MGGQGKGVLFSRTLRVSLLDQGRLRMSVTADDFYLRKIELGTPKLELVVALGFLNMQFLIRKQTES